MAEKRYGGKVLEPLDKVNKNMGLSDGLHFPTMKPLDKKETEENK